MKLIRIILGALIRIVDILFAPKLKVLPEEKLNKLQSIIKDMTVYEFKNCPFCVKLRWSLLKQGVNLEYKDAKRNTLFKQELVEGGGKAQVPCLRYIKNGKTEWMYESSDIAQYIQQQVASV